MTNRFVEKEARLARPFSRFNPRPATSPYARGMKKKEDCKQFNEIAVDDDQFVLDILKFFFEEDLLASQLNDDLREIAATCIWEAIKATDSMDMVPRPPGGAPGIGWLVTQAVQIAIRRQQNKCVYEAVRVTVARNFKSAYEIAKMSGMQSIMQSAAPANRSIPISARGIELIKHFEGFRGDLYNDPAGHCTIGYGHLVHRGNCDGSESAEFRSGITQARATELLIEKVHAFERTVNEKVKVDITQEEFDALVSFCYNVGSGAFSGSTLLRKLNEGDFAAVPSELKRWNKGGGRVLPGLVRRRETEAKLFSEGVYPGHISAGQSLYAELSLEDDPETMDLEEFDDPSSPALAQSLTVPSCCTANPASTAGTAHFGLHEFACKDGTAVPTDLCGHVQKLMEQLEVLRTELGNTPIKVISGYRTVSYNTRIGGATRSRHLCAQAADIQVDGYTPKQVADTIERLIAAGKMMQGGLGRYSTFTHYDVRGRRARWGSN